MAAVQFEFTARNAQGQRIQGQIDAENSDEATGKLRQRGMAVVKLEEKKAKRQQSLFSGSAPRRANTAELALFTRQLATMLSAGIPLLEGIQILSDQVKEQNKGFGLGLGEIADLVRGGTGLSEALTQYPRIFPEIYVNMVKAGEASGQLDLILNRLADYMEASESLKREIKSAMTYPVISLVMILGITVYLLVGVVPKFEQMFNKISQGSELPAVTRFVLSISNYVQAQYLLVLGVIAGIIVTYTLVHKHPKVRQVVDTIKLKMPVFGALNQKVAVSRFARTFATLLSSGVPILGALEIVARTSGNKIIEDAVLETRETVRSGESLTSHLVTCWVFPPMVVKMIAIGEKSGALEMLLSKIADFYDEQVNATVKSLTSLIEPIMIGVMGTIVGTIVLAIFWPILEMQKNLTAQNQ